jgi:hypothetical protein
MNWKKTLTIAILSIVILAIIGATLQVFNGGLSPDGAEHTPFGSFTVVEAGNNQIIILSFESDRGDAPFRDCILRIEDPQGNHYSWNLNGIIWTYNEARNNSTIPGIELRIFRSSDQTSFRTANLVEIVNPSGPLLQGNWVFTLIFGPTGGAIATKAVVVQS